MGSEPDRFRVMGPEQTRAVAAREESSLHRAPAAGAGHFGHGYWRGAPGAVSLVCGVRSSKSKAGFEGATNNMGSQDRGRESSVPGTRVQRDVEGAILQVREHGCWPPWAGSSGVRRRGRWGLVGRPADREPAGPDERLPEGERLWQDEIRRGRRGGVRRHPARGDPRASSSSRLTRFHHHEKFSEPNGSSRVRSRRSALWRFRLPGLFAAVTGSTRENSSLVQGASAIGDSQISGRKADGERSSARIGNAPKTTLEQPPSVKRRWRCSEIGRPQLGQISICATMELIAPPNPPLSLARVMAKRMWRESGI